MCYRTALTAKPHEIAERYNRKEDEILLFQPDNNINAFAHENEPIITESSYIIPMRWGLIPFWVDKPEEAIKIQNQTLNARSETIFTKPSFREAIKTKRCLVPVTGFYDWRHENGKKTPYFITLKNQDIFSLAGIYDIWHDKNTRKSIATFSIITTQANELMRYIHNTNFRMPVIISKENEEKWLKPTLSQEEIKKLMFPYPHEQMNGKQLPMDYFKR